MTEDYGDRLDRHEEMIQALARVWTRQSELNEEQRAMNQRLEGYIQRQDAFNASVARTLARIETLLDRFPPRGDNGRET